MECILDVIPSRKIITIPPGSRIISLKNILTYPIYSVNQVINSNTPINKFRLINIDDNEAYTDWTEMHLMFNLNEPHNFLQKTIMENDSHTSECLEILLEKYNIHHLFINSMLEHAAIEFEAPIENYLRISFNGYKVIYIENGKADCKYSI